MTKNLTITIEGKSGSGKTHIAAYLRRILYRDGFDVIVDDPDLTEENIDVTGTKDIIHAMKSSISIEINRNQNKTTNATCNSKWVSSHTRIRVEA